VSLKYVGINVISNGVRNLILAGSYKISPFGRDDNYLWDATLDHFVNTDPAISAVRLIAVSTRCSKTIEVPLPLLLFPIKRLQGLDETLHA
jgi:hypothetical protein